MINHQNSQSPHKSKKSLRNKPSHSEPQISPLRQRFIRDMELFTRKKVRKPRRQRLPVPIAWADGHRLIAALQKPIYWKTVLTSESYKCCSATPVLVRHRSIPT